MTEKPTAGAYQVSGRLISSLMPSGFRKGIQQFVNRIWIQAEAEKTVSVEEISDTCDLIAEALNVHHETGMTPAQLAARVKTLEQRIASSDTISPCACCGVKLAWVWAGDGTSCVEALTGDKHNCSVSSDDFQNKRFPNDSYRYMEHRVKTLEAERAELIASCREFRDAVLHGRHCLEEPCLDGEQTNAVLNQFDDTIGAKLEWTREE